jgi:hypothetical protein
MTKADDTYQNSKVQLPQGADRLSIDSDGYFDFFGTTVDGQSLKNILAYPCTASIIANTGGVLSVVNLPHVGTIILSIADAASNASAWLCSGVKAGQRLVIITRGIGSTGSVIISTSGVTINDTRVSNISIRNSVDSMAIIELVGIGDEKWAVVSTVGGVTLADGI